MEHDVNFAPAPDPPLFEGEIENFDFDFDSDTSDEPSSPPAKPAVEIQPVDTINQGNQETVATQNPDERQAEESQSQSFEEPIPNPEPFESTPSTKAPA